MELNVGKEIAALKRMTVGELRERYAEVFGEETHARNKQWLVKRVGGCSRCPKAPFPSEHARVRRNWRTMPTCGDGRRNN